MAWEPSSVELRNMRRNSIQNRCSPDPCPEGWEISISKACLSAGREGTHIVLLRQPETVFTKLNITLLPFPPFVLVLDRAGKYGRTCWNGLGSTRFSDVHAVQVLNLTHSSAQSRLQISFFSQKDIHRLLCVPRSSDVCQ